MMPVITAWHFRLH